MMASRTALRSRVQATIRFRKSRRSSDPEAFLLPSRKIQRSFSAGLEKDVGLADELTSRTVSPAIRSEIGMEAAIDRETSICISHHAYRPALIELIFTLDDFGLGLGYICGKGKNEILCDAF